MDLPAIARCQIKTPKMIITIAQLSGREQAALFPTVEAWAAPFTW